MNEKIDDHMWKTIRDEGLSKITKKERKLPNEYKGEHKDALQISK